MKETLNEKHSKQQVKPEGTKPMSSVTLVLARLNEEIEKKEAAAEAAKTRCKTCFKELTPTRRCGGHGGGGTSEESASAEDLSDSSSFETSSDLDKKSQPDFSETEEFYVVKDLDLKLSTDVTFNQNIIADLIEEGLLLVENDPESKTLSIKLLCPPDSLNSIQKSELNKYMKAIIKEFEAFKNGHNLSKDCLQVLEDKQGNTISLQITLPTLALYNTFIQRLGNNLVPTPAPKAEKQDSAKEKQTSNDEEKDKSQLSTTPSPFSTQFKP